MYNLLKPILFKMAPERAHHQTMGLFSLVLKIPIVNSLFTSSLKHKDQGLAKNVMGIDFANPIGLAAGFDKNGDYITAMHELGFGFIEVGTVTPKPQVGNPQPRLFRLPKNNALINRMGFNNEGVDNLVKNIEAIRDKNLPIIIGGNIGKNKTTPNEVAIDDYLICFEKLYDHVDYFVVNVSSPNTPNLRELQEKEPLTKLLQTLLEKRKLFKTKKPILLKIAPDLNDHQLNDIVSIINDLDIDGIVASNTTIDRSALDYSQKHLAEIGNGGLSGQPVQARSTTIIKYLRTHLSADKVIIGVGGIQSAKSAQEKIDAGADLIQIYTGLIYEGPYLVKEIKKHLKINV